MTKIHLEYFEPLLMQAEPQHYLPSFVGAGTASFTGALGSVVRHQTHVRVHEVYILVEVLPMQLKCCQYFQLHYRIKLVLKRD